MKLIDAHCHLDFDAFDADRDAVMQRAADSGIEHIIVPGVDIGNWHRITSLCDDDDRLSACYGLHPYRVAQHDPEHLDELKRILATRDCVAVGECGLDYREGMADRELQHFYFTRQLEIAEEMSKPVVIHSVKATQHVIDILKRFSGLRGMIHSYSGSYEQARQLHDMGFLLSFGGGITYHRASRLRQTVNRLPLSALLIETDAPDQVVAAHKGERNEPAYLAQVFDTLCKLREEESETIATQLYENTAELFAI